MKSNFTKLSLAEQDKSKTVKFTTDAKNGVTVCRLYDRWFGRSFVGVTRCHNVDTFDEKIGRAIAFNKARRKELLSDIALLKAQRERLTRMYEQKMSRIDKNEGLKHIYLAGVNEELNELMGNVPLSDDETLWAGEGDDATDSDMFADMADDGADFELHNSSEK